jgi:DNA replication and repair protein RecF
LIVASVAADRIRSLEGVEIRLDPGLTALVGPNGAGKTNLVEAAYFALTARSFRTADRRELIPFGSSWARSRVTVRTDSGVSHEFMASVSREQGSRYSMDGAPVERSEAVNHRPMVSVFSPDRLDLVKGPPSVRRAHLDSWIAARWPGRSGIRSRFGRALAQRNALVVAISSGRGQESELETWNRQVADAAAELTAVRADAAAELTGPYQEATEVLGLSGANALAYRPSSPADPEEVLRGLQERTETDLRLGRTSWGPHHDELRLELDGRQLRRYGSQGQQRIGLLALLFAERSALLAAGSSVPLMLLDDVMSELDGYRREVLVERLLEGGQCVITAAEPDLVPDSQGVNEVRTEELFGGDQGDVQTGES